MKRIFLLLLMAPLISTGAANKQQKRSLSKETKVKTAVGVGAAAVVGLAAYEAYKYWKTNELSDYSPLQLGEEKMKEIAKYVVSTLVAAVVGQQYAYQTSPDGRIDRAQAEMNKISRHILEICKKCDNAEEFYKEIEQFFFYSHFPLITAFAQLDQYDTFLINAEELLIVASGNDEVNAECNALLEEARGMRRVLVEAMLTLKNHPEWSNQMNSRNLVSNERPVCERGYCA